MKKTLLASTICAILAFNASTATAESSEEENVGFLAGALSGALLGGPVGFVIGGISGVVMGEQVNKANQVERMEQQLLVEQDENQAISTKVEQLEAQISTSTSQAMKAADWITEDLTLNLMFTTGSTKLSANDLQMVTRLSKLLTEYPELNIRLNGYSDIRGDEESNMALSESRTRVVEQAFADNGIDSTRLNITAHGEAESSSTTNPDDYAMDRRVSINFYTPSSSTVAQN